MVFFQSILVYQKVHRRFLLQIAGTLDDDLQSCFPGVLRIKELEVYKRRNQVPDFVRVFCTEQIVHFLSGEIQLFFVLL